MSSKRIALIIAAAVAASLVLTAAVEFAYAIKYSMRVKVIAGKRSFGVNPLTTSVDFGDMPRGGRSIRFVSLDNDGRRPAYVWVVMRGEIADFVTAKPSSLLLQPGKAAKLSFEMYVPASAPLKAYEGRVYIFRFPKLL